jgi:hypothetical protein
MHCVKLLGQRLSARDFDCQVAEIQIRAVILNGFTALGVISPFLMGLSRRIHAAVFSFIAGDITPMPMLGLSLL